MENRAAKGSSISLHGVTGSMPGLEQPISLGDVTFRASAKSAPRGGYHIAAQSMPACRYEADRIVFAAKNLTME